MACRVGSLETWTPDMGPELMQPGWLRRVSGGEFVGAGTGGLLAFPARRHAKIIMAQLDLVLAPS